MTIIMYYDDSLTSNLVRDLGIEVKGKCKVNLILLFELNMIWFRLWV